MKPVFSAVGVRLRYSEMHSDQIKMILNMHLNLSTHSIGEICMLSFTTA